MGWEGTETEEVYSPPERIDPFPFTAEGRRLERLEHELRLEEARLKVDRLEAQKRELQSALRNARQGRRGASHPV
jgi:hypothetical protein